MPALTIANPCCRRGPATCFAITRASSDATTDPTANGSAMPHAMAPCQAAAPTPPIEASAITASDVATTLRADSSVKRVSAGTMTKPPPTPSSPLSTPASAPVKASAWAHGRVHTRRPSRASITQGSVAHAEGACGAVERAALPCVLDARDGRLVWTRPCAQALAVTGVAAGLLSGLLGVGGGFVIVPALTRFTELSARSVVATSLAVIALGSIGGVGAAAWHGAIAWDIALPFAAGSVLASLLARVIARRVAGPRLQQGFAVVSACIAALLLMRGLGALATR